MNEQFSFSQAVEGFLMAAHSRHLSPNTTSDYLNTFREFQDFINGDPTMPSISYKQVETFLACQPVSKKTTLNYHIGLSALWKWAVKEELTPTHIVHSVERTKPEKRSIVPQSLIDIKAMLSVLKRSRAYTWPGKRESSNGLQNAEWALAIDEKALGPDPNVATDVNNLGRVLRALSDLAEMPSAAASPQPHLLHVAAGSHGLSGHHAGSRSL